MRKLTDMQIAEVCRRYQAGESSKALAKEFDVSAPAICGLLERRNIARREQSLVQRRYTCNHTFFSSIDSEEKAYWLGFIAADGYISNSKESKSALVLVLQWIDKDHLVQLQETLQSTHPVKEYHYSYQDMAKLFIRSEQLTHDLATYGIVGNKTFSLQWPSLPYDLLRHFLRGYVDGDGGFYTSKTAYKRKNVIFSVTSNEQFLEGMQQFLMSSLGLPKTIHSQRHKESPIFMLRYCGRNQVERIVSWLYKDATVYLPRKYTKIIDYLQAMPPL